ncbi:hypothetical protein [Achromobacter pulmonis]|uniref:hypothetical protein n=1 Tax=Achromobacter pulmonis TaxID=1389932 RepID=UPI001F425FF8|nr:hypothetical protein [Achromobacter pulmonis]MCF7769747.1 hypothetical protein [Achromobacter pulmonis]
MLLSTSTLALLSLAVLAWRIRRRPPGLAPRDIGRAAAGGAALYLFMGPPIGVLVLSLMLAVAARSAEHLLTSILLIPWAYLFGGVPALLSGLVAGACKPALASGRAYCLAGLVGGLYGTVFLLGLSSRDGAWHELPVPLIAGGVPGLVAGALCARALYGRRGTTASANG